jgi:hypothetical protein
LIHARESASHARVVRECLDRPQLPLSSLEQTHDVRFARNIALDRDSAPARSHNVMNYFRSFDLAGGEVDHNRVSACARERGDGRANSAASTGHNESAQLFVVVGHVNQKGKTKPHRNPRSKP